MTVVVLAPVLVLLVLVLVGRAVQLELAVPVMLAAQTER